MKQETSIQDEYEVRHSQKRKSSMPKSKRFKTKRDDAAKNY